jgi:heme/copper-type cytochrome/quinol oxidase subunit 2
MSKKLIFSVFIWVSSIFCAPVLAITCPSADFESSTGVCIPTSASTKLPVPPGKNPLKMVLKNVMMWLLGVVGFIAIIAFVISGMQYLLSAGDQNMIETAKRNMKWSIVGVIVALMGLIILNFIINMLGGIEPEIEPTSLNNKTEKNILV